MITAHTLVKNEENFLWYSVMSVVDYIDQIFIWDTGSTDTTKEIAKELVKKYPKKIYFREVGDVDEKQYSKIRQQMLEETKDGWILILDGDEIYFRESILNIVSEINKNGNRLESVVVPTINLVGDMFHFQEKSAGRYKFGKRIGHFALRFVNTAIPGLHVDAPYGKEGFFDDKNLSIQNRDSDKIKFIDAPYVHTTHLARSSRSKDVMQRIKKLKYEFGLEFPKDFYYPESFFISRPEFVPNIWKNVDLIFRLKAYVSDPLRKIKRVLW